MGDRARGFAGALWLLYCTGQQSWHRQPWLLLHPQLRMFVSGLHFALDLYRVVTTLGCWVVLEAIVRSSHRSGRASCRAQKIGCDLTRARCSVLLCTRTLSQSCST